MTRTAKIKPATVDLDADPVWQAFLNAPMGPPDPPEVRAAIREAEQLGQFVPGREVSAEIARRRRACEKPGK
jgi:hypothetical protein